MKSFKVHSKGFGTEIDITDNIKKSLKNNDKDGIMKIYSSGSTNALVIMRYERGVVEDFKRTLENIAPKNYLYNHQLTTDDDNGFSHIYSMILGNYVLLPYRKKEVLISDTHRVVLFDFDLRNSERTIFVDL